MLRSILLIYIALGLFIMTCTRAKETIAESIRDVNTMKHALWKVALFRVIIFTGALFLWPIFLKGWLAKK